MARLFGRRCNVIVNKTKLSPFQHVSFKIEKSLKPEPNTCELRIINLNVAHRAELEQIAPTRTLPAGQLALVPKRVLRGIPVSIEAGYEDPTDPNGNNLSQLWLGDLRTQTSVPEGPDWITSIASGDAEKAFQNARINVTYGPKTPLETALRALVRSMKIGEGNLFKILSELQIKGYGRLFPRGTVLSGSSAQELNEICKSADLEWSIQDGALQILNRGKALDATILDPVKGFAQPARAIRVSEATGMIGSPTVDNDGILNVQILFTPNIRPGYLIDMDAKRIKGGYRIEKAVWTGDTGGDDWTIDIQAKKW